MYLFKGNIKGYSHNEKLINSLILTKIKDNP